MRTALISALRWVAAGRLLGQIITWALTIVTIRLLTPADYGVVAAALLLISVLAILQESGFRAVLIRRRDMEPEHRDRLFGAFLLATLGLTVFAALAAWPLGLYLGDTRVAPVVWLVALTLPVNIGTVFPLALLEKELAMRPVALVELGASLAQGIGTAGLALAGAGYWALAGGMVIASVIKAIAFWRYAPADLRPRFGWHGLREDWRYGRTITAQALIYTVTSNFDVAVVGRVLGAGPLGLFRTASELVFMPASKLMPIINRVAFPAYARAQEDRALIARAFRSKLGVFMAVMVAPLWGLAAVAPEFTIVVLGAQWRALPPLLWALGLAAPFFTVSLLFNAPFDALGRPELSVQSNLIRAGLTLVTLIVGAQFGLETLIWVYGAGLALAGLIIAWIGLKVLGVWRRQALADMAAPLAAGLAMIGGIHLMRTLLALSAALELPLLIATGALCYCGVLWLLGRQQIRAAIALVRGQ